MCASDLWRVLKLDRSSLQRLEQRIDFFKEDIGRVAQQQRVGGIDYIRRRQTVMNETACFTNRLREVCGKGDDVVIRRLFNFVNTLN
jgi:hypothetical protein